LRAELPKTDPQEPESIARSSRASDQFSTDANQAPSARRPARSPRVRTRFPGEHATGLVAPLGKRLGAFRPSIADHPLMAPVRADSRSATLRT
jgi:hypothetical protein